MTVRLGVLFEVMGCCALLLAVVLSAWPTLAEEGETMTLEDVVRLFVQGTSPEELIRRIESSRVDFDLTEEMLDELRLAGLSEDVIEAMERRQHELHPPEVPETAVDDEPVEELAGLTVRLTLKGGMNLRAGDEDRGLRVIDLVPQETLAQLGVRDVQARITNVAIYVACHASTHVPDHWRGKTPLGRDFTSVTRHKLLAFHSEATEETPGATKKALIAALLGGSASPDDAEVIVSDLQVPVEIAIELDPADEHDLSVGVAVQIDGRYYRVVSDETRGFVPADHEGSIDVTFELPDNLVLGEHELILQAADYAGNTSLSSLKFVCEASADSIRTEAGF